MKQEYIFVTPKRNLHIIRKASNTTIVDGIPVKTRGEKISFSNGQFRTTDEKVARYLRERAGFTNGDYTELNAEEVEQVKKGELIVERDDKPKVVALGGSFPSNLSVKKCACGEHYTNEVVHKEECKLVRK